ncbi:dihydrodipicolinate synthetase family protein [Niveomyces insectorum RCEF 264]|uniref:Dihydrodipicolinate synthetase family protein n=1 Tax=Niveomyces insectorum RCEF 264 TaxID=1081102 RepID=A0A167VHS3_9HYPO|nr:dihydrodipicolinate synthetase family protein [Niveomyces insectorum RCEF 264]
MSPHNDAPSSSNSYVAGFNQFSPSRDPAVASSALRLSGFVSADAAASPLSSSYDSSTSLDATAAVPPAAAAAAAAAAAGAVGGRTTRRPLLPGVYVPTLCFFDPETEDAWEAGGDAALVLPPSYYAPLFAAAGQTIVDYFTEVADASPLPLLIYNFPGAVNGMDLSSDMVVRLAAHPNIVGVKLTCGNTGKLSRVVAATRHHPLPSKGAAAVITTDQQQQQQQQQPGFLVLAGSADFTIQSLVAGGHGILAGLANLAPKACIRTVELFRQGKLAEAQALQETLAQGDWTAIQGGVVGVKAGLQAWSGYGGYARRPLPRPTAEQTKQWKEGYRALMMLEKSL